MNPRATYHGKIRKTRGLVGLGGYGKKSPEETRQWPGDQSQGGSIPPVSQPASGTGGTKIDVAWYPCYHVLMIRTFKDRGTEEIFNGRDTKAARKQCPRRLWTIAARKLEQLDSVVDLRELAVPPGNRLEALAGDRLGQYSIRVAERYRICFHWSEEGPMDAEIVDYH
jgi:toxin HigB-1